MQQQRKKKKKEVFFSLNIAHTQHYFKSNHKLHTQHVILRQKKKNEKEKLKTFDRVLYKRTRSFAIYFFIFIFS